MTSEPIQCSFCSAIIQSHESRYLCANCPVVNIDAATGKTNKEGYNLCANCETHSLQCHDPSHFFFKIQGLPRGRGNPSSQRVRLGDRWEIKELGGGPLAPTLYADLSELAAAQQQNGSHQNNGNQHVPGSYRFPPLPSSTQAPSESHCPGSHFRRWTSKACAPSSSSSSSSSSSNSSTANTMIRGEELPLSSCRSTEGGVKDENSYELEMLGKRKLLVPLQQLVHPSILCDNCYVVVEGETSPPPTIVP